MFISLIGTEYQIISTHISNKTLFSSAQAIILLGFGCAAPQRIIILYLFYIISLLFLFKNFADKTYKTKRRAENAVEEVSTQDKKPLSSEEFHTESGKKKQQ